MKACAIVVGIDRWKNNTEKFYESFRKYEPDMPLVIIDNFSPDGYPDLPDADVVRTNFLMGYGSALNLGILCAPDDTEWFLCFNNDNLVEGPLSTIVETLRPDELYGSGENYDNVNDIHFQWSAWLVFHRSLNHMIGTFDPDLRYAFEDFDFELRAMKCGFGLETAHLPVVHTAKS